MSTQLENLKKLTTVVCDTGDINTIKKYAPQDATTNPSLIFQATKDPEYNYLIEDAINYGMSKTSHEKHMLAHIMDKLFVNFGVEILKIVPGRVSTEVDARLSFDVTGSIHKAVALIDLYERAGVDRKRVLIKLASTWEGVLAAKHLESEEIRCNMTLLFSLPQAVACAEAKATLISPFVGRILDWYKFHQPETTFTLENDPGVLSVKTIYNYYKKFGYKTQVMGASFRSTEQILELAGCDLLTITPKYLELLSKNTGNVSQKLSVLAAQSKNIEKLEIDEKHFRFLLNDDQMANDKLADGIRIFTADIFKLESHLLERIAAKTSKR